jgi:hypothetical protein
MSDMMGIRCGGEKCFVVSKEGENLCGFKEDRFSPELFKQSTLIYF